MMISLCSRSFIAPEGALRSPVTTHAVDTAARWCGRGAEVNARERGGILAPGRPQEELQTGERAAVDVASHQVLVPGVHGLGVKDRPSQNAVAKAGSEALDLVFDSFESRTRPTVGDVAISPGHMLSLRSPAGVEECWLG